MRKFINNLFLLCGAALMLAASSVFAQNGAEINKKPFEDLAYSINDKIQKKEIDLNAAFSVELNAVLTKEGKFDVKKSRFAKPIGDEQMIEVVKSSFEAIGDSGLLKYLQSVGIENLVITVKQDDKTLTVQFVSELPTANKAKTIESGLKTLLSLGIQKVEGDDEKALLNAASTKSDGKKFILNFAMPKEIYQEMLLRKLKAAQAKQQSAGNS